MSNTLNSTGKSHADALVASGNVDKDSSWSFSAEDGNKLLGANGDDWANYGKWFLGVDKSASADTKAYYKYPFGKDGKVYRLALTSAKGYAAQQNDSAIEDACSELLDKIDGKAARVPVKKVWSTIQIKSYDDNKRTFTGIASTPTPDRMDDIVEPMGAQFTLPLPLLWMHDATQPVGHIIAAKATKKGIEVTGQLAQVDGPASLKEMLDTAWAMLKAELVRGLSIGFNPLEYEEIKGSYGYRYTKWDWLELSCVTIPANMEASITSVKAMDTLARGAALGTLTSPIAKAKLKYPGASGSVHILKGEVVKTTKERIKEFEATRQAKSAEMQGIMDKANDEGRTFNAEEKEQYATLSSEVKSIDEHLVTLRDHEKLMLDNMTSVDGTTDAGKAGAGSGQSQGNDGKKDLPRIVHGKSNLPAGTAFTRYAIALAAAKGMRGEAARIAQQFGWRDTTPEVENVLNIPSSVLKASVNVGTTTDSTWASPLVQYTNMASEFIDLLRPTTIIGKMVGLRRVPFNIRFPSQTGAGTVGWVGQNLSKPASALAFATSTLGFAKAAGIVVITQELAEFSAPSAVQLVQSDMLETMRVFLDQQFISPSVAAVSNVSPASITNGISAIQANAAPMTLASIEIDIQNLFGALIAQNVPMDGLVWVMTPTTALSISQLRTTNGPYAFPDINVNGGVWFGYPVITSNSVPHSTSAGGIIVLCRPQDIFMADDGAVQLDASQEASVQMSDAPASGAQSLVSLWQNNLLGIRAERVINWQRRRDVSVTYLDNVH